MVHNEHCATNDDSGAECTCLGKWLRDVPPLTTRNSNDTKEEIMITVEEVDE